MIEWVTELRGTSNGARICCVHIDYKYPILISQMHDFPPHTLLALPIVCANGFLQFDSEPWYGCNKILFSKQIDEQK